MTSDFQFRQRAAALGLGGAMAAAMRLSARLSSRAEARPDVANLDGAETVARIQVAEALAYRALPTELAFFAA